MRNSWLGAAVVTLASLSASLPAATVQLTASVNPAQPCTRKFGDPVPRGGPGDWVTSSDYPAAALRQELSGKVRFRVNVTAEGRVEKVEILETLGDPSFAGATIRVLTRRARFTPAVRNCQPVPGEYEGTINWAAAQ